MNSTRGCSTMKIELQLFFMEKTQQLQQGVLKSQGKFLKKCITKQGIAPFVKNSSVLFCG